MKKIWAMVTVLVLCVLATACTGFGLFVVNAPTHFDDVKITQNVAFGLQPWQKLDIYAPPNAAGHALDVIVFYYGGRWETGAKADYRFVGSALARQGFLVIIPDYRKYPEVGFPQFVDDAAASLAWSYRHAADYGGNPQRLHLAGHSAGAHIAALLTANPAYLKAYGLDRSAVIHDFAGLAGPYDFVPTDKDLVALFGPPSRYPQMQATTFIDGSQPPMLLLWGNRDQYVGRVNMDKLSAAIKERGGCVETRIYPNVDHIKIVSALSWIGGPPVLGDMAAFFRDPDVRKDCGRSSP